jgi:Ca-activated chloride channel homolog
MRRTPLTLPLFLALTALLLPVAPAQAGVVLPDDAPEHPQRTPLTLVSQQVDVTIVDQVATTTLVQVFRNDGPSPVAGTYLLPLNERASVMEYAFWVGGRRVVSSVQEKAQAENTLDGAERRGEEASVLSHRDPDTFTARFTTLDPGETRRFEVVYGELLPYEAGIVRYSHPLDYKTMGLPEVDDVRVRVRVTDSKPITALTSSTWDIDVSETPGGMVAESRMTGAVPQADYELAYTLQGSDFGLSFRTYADGEDDGFFVAMVAPQEQTTDHQIVRKDVAFVFDVSGSMEGVKMDQARSALKACLNLMNPGDGAYVVAFNDGMDPWRSKVSELDSSSRAAATEFVDGLNAGGGTNIQDAVLSTLDLLERSERPTAIVFLTDGLGNRPVEETLDKVRAEAGNTRIFSFGVGPDVNQSFLERLGRENRGNYTSIRGNLGIEEAVGAFYSSISQPVLTDLRLDMGDVVGTRTYPAVMPDVYKGQRLVLTGRYRGDGPQTLTVSGRIGGQERTLELPIDFPKQDTEHPWVARLWAKRRAEHLLADIRMYGESNEGKDEIIALSTQYSFATPYTSLVAHADPRVASLTPARVKPGDPVLAIPAPMGSIAVTAFLPFGEVKDLVYDDESGLWVTRFLVPRSADDGVYWIHVVATDERGLSEWFKVSYTIDTLAPVVRVDLDGGEGDSFFVGEAIEISTRPIIGFLELGSEMIRALGRDAAARAKAFVDVKTVIARVAGTDLETKLVSTLGAEPGWHGTIELPVEMAPGDYRLEVTATDVAGNKHTVTRDIEVRRGAVTAIY